MYPQTLKTSFCKLLPERSGGTRLWPSANTFTNNRWEDNRWPLLQESLELQDHGILSTLHGRHAKDNLPRERINES